MKKRESLGEILLRNNMISADTLRVYLERQRTEDGRLGDLLIKGGILTEEQVVEAVSLQGHPRVNLLALDSYDDTVLTMFDVEYLRKNLVVPFEAKDGVLRAVMHDQSNFMVVDYLLSSSGYKRIDSCVGTKSEIEQFLNLRFGSNFIPVEEDEDPDIEETDILDLDSPLVKHVNEIIENAIRDGASDIHIEPQHGKESRVRYRVDGRLRVIDYFPRKWHKRMVSRLKVMSELNIANQLSAQDGDLSYRMTMGVINLRINFTPTVIGEKIVLRIMGMSSALLSLDEIGLIQENKEILVRNLDKHRGMILVAAATGEGKSTTLYSALEYLNVPEVNITSIEDSVEIKLPGVNQIKVSKNIPYDAALTSILRQDPDIIMVGEMRDKETATTATRASITGHLVLSTIHTSDVYGVIGRLADMGVPNYMIAGALTLVISQRLIGRLCHKCKIEDEEGSKMLADITGDSSNLAYKSQGCTSCGNTGIKGRVAIFEMLEITRRIRDLISRGEIQDVYDEPLTSIPMYQDGLEKVKLGLINYKELLSVLGVSHSILKKMVNNEITE